MNALNIQTGWWVVANDRFVAVYNTKEEAINHIKFQKEQMGSTPANAICFNGQLTKEHLSEKLFRDYDNRISIIFFEQEGEPDMPDDYTLIIKSE